MSQEQPSVPDDFVTAPRSLGTFPAAYVNRVLYGDLRDAWRTVIAAPDCPDGVRQFLTMSVPPLPIFFAEFETADGGTSYRRGWLIAPRIARVDQAGADGSRELLFEPLADLVAADLADARIASVSRIVLMFPTNWAGSRTLLGRRRSAPFAPGQAPKLDLRLRGEQVESVEQQPSAHERRGLADQPIGEVVETWIDHWWPRVTGPE